MSSTSVGPFSPGKRHSQIPVLSRFDPNSQRVEAKKRATSIDMISPKSFTYHNRTGPPRTSNAISNESRSNSPLLEKQTHNARSKSTCTRNSNMKIKPAGMSERSRANGSLKKQITENKVNYTKSSTTITLPPSPGTDDSDRGPGQLSTPDSKGNLSNFTNELSSPDEPEDFNPSIPASKTSSYTDTACPCGSPRSAEPPPGSEYSKLCRINQINEDEPLLEPLDLSVRDSESQIYSTVPGSANSSTREETPVESHAEDGSEAAVATAGTPSGDELAFSSWTEFEIDNDPGEGYAIPGGVPDDAPGPLLKETEDESSVSGYGGLLLIDDDTNEYDSGETTDVDVPARIEYSKSETDFPGNDREPENGARAGAGNGTGDPGPKSIWSGRENEILTDVNYRQFVYHPTVLKRKTRDRFEGGSDGPVTESKQDLTASETVHSRMEKGERSIKTSFKKNIQQAYVSNRDVNITPLRAWSDKNPEQDDIQIYDRLNLMRNSEYVFKGLNILFLIRIALSFFQLFLVGTYLSFRTKTNDEDVDNNEDDDNDDDVESKKKSTQHTQTSI